MHLHCRAQHDVRLVPTDDRGGVILGLSRRRHQTCRRVDERRCQTHFQNPSGEREAVHCLDGGCGGTGVVIFDKAVASVSRGRRRYGCEVEPVVRGVWVRVTDQHARFDGPETRKQSTEVRLVDVPLDAANVHAIA